MGLLRREVLELALYTLKYVPNTDAVIAYLPPPGDPGVAAKAILISRKDVKANLDLPLRRTLKPRQVVLGGGLAEGGHVGELTSSRTSTSNYQTCPVTGRRLWRPRKPAPGDRGRRRPQGTGVPQAAGAQAPCSSVWFAPYCDGADFDWIVNQLRFALVA